MPWIVRSLLAVAAGYVVGFLIAFAGSAGATALFPVPPSGIETTGFLVMTIAVSFLAAVCAGYLCARFAPQGRMMFTLGLMLLAMLLTAVVWVRFSPNPSQPPASLAVATLLGVIGIWAGAMTERAVRG